MEKKKILYIITQGEWGGAQRYVFDLATNLPPEFEVTVAVGEPGGRRELQEKLEHVARNTHRVSNMKIIQLRHLVRRISLIHDALAIFELKKMYKQIKPDVIHLNSSKAGIIGSIAGHMLRDTCYVKIVYTVHGWVFNEPLAGWRKKLYFYLEKFTAPMKDGIIVLSNAERDQSHTELAIPSKKITVIPHGISVPTEMLSKQAARDELTRLSHAKVPLDTTWIGTIANYYPTKGLDVLIKAVAQKKQELGNISCLLIGDGPERTKLAGLIIKYGLEKIVYLVGIINDAWKYHPAFDVFVLPSRKEGLPYALLDAMAYKARIVTTNVGGIPSIVEDKKTGLLVPPDDPPALGDAIVILLKNPAQLHRDHPAAVFSLANELAKTTSLYHSLWGQE